MISPDTALGVATPAGDLGAVLAVLCEHAVALTTSVPHPPDRVRLEASGAVLELGWGTGGAGQPPARPVAPPATLPPVSEQNGTAVPVPTPGTHRLTAPTVGTFHRAPEPGADPYVAEGDVVTAGQQVGIVEAMKLMIPVEADRGGRVVEVLCGNGEPVEYGQALFALDAS